MSMPVNKLYQLGPFGPNWLKKSGSSNFMLSQGDFIPAFQALEGTADEEGQGFAGRGRGIRRRDGFPWVDDEKIVLNYFHAHRAGEPAHPEQEAGSGHLDGGSVRLQAGTEKALAPYRSMSSSVTILAQPPGRRGPTLMMAILLSSFAPRRRCVVDGGGFCRIDDQAAIRGLKYFFPRMHSPGGSRPWAMRMEQSSRRRFR